MAGDYTNYQGTLIDAFFHEQDQKLLKAFRERTEKLDRRAQLAAVSGIQDEAVLDRLVELNIGPDTLAAMSVVPLVCVAWADKKVQDEERRAIVAAAEAAGVKSQDGRYPLLEFWLNERPGPELIDAWKHYVRALCRKLEPQEIERLKHDLLDRARDVAAAAGGFMGLGSKISAAERAVLEELGRAFA